MDEEMNIYPESSTDTILNELSLPAMKDLIIDQIHTKTLFDDNMTDVFNIVITKFKIILDTVEDVDDINEEIIYFCQSIIEEICNEYNIGCSYYDFDSLKIIDLTETLYEFFILDKKINVISFLTDYITKQKKTLIDVLGLPMRGKDLTSASNKAKNIPKEDIPILSHINRILEYICNELEIRYTDVIDLINDGNINLVNMKDYIDTNVLSDGNASSNYIGKVYNDDDASLRNVLRQQLTKGGF